MAFKGELHSGDLSGANNMIYRLPQSDGVGVLRGSTPLIDTAPSAVYFDGRTPTSSPVAAENWGFPYSRDFAQAEKARVRREHKRARREWRKETHGATPAIDLQPGEAASLISAVTEPKAIEEPKPPSVRLREAMGAYTTLAAIEARDREIKRLIDAGDSPELPPHSFDEATLAEMRKAAATLPADKIATIRENMELPPLDEL